MSKSGLIVLVTIFASLCLTAGGCGGILLKPVPLEQTLREAIVGGDRGMFVSDRILILDVDGVIVNHRSTSIFGGDNPVSLFVEKLDRAESDSSLAGVILRINSPGGSVSAVDIMARRLERFRKARPGVPVVALIQDVGASGGYYLACCCDEIIALPTSITGSIGVIMQTFSISDGLGMFGIHSRAIVSGKYKDLASPFKPLDAEDSGLLQTIVDEFYADFVKIVADGREDLSVEQVRKLADGRVYTGKQAMEVGLVDSLGDMHEAEAIIKRKSGKEKVVFIMYHRPMGWRGSVESTARVSQPKILISPDSVSDLARPRFMYLWQ